MMMDDLDLLDAEKQANGKASAAPVEADAEGEAEAKAKATSSTIDDTVICSTPKRAKQPQQQHQTQQLHGRARGVTQSSHQKDVAVVGDSPTATASYSSRGGGNGIDGGRSIDGSNNNINDETLLDGFCVEYQHHQLQQQSPTGPDVTPRPLLARIGRVVVDGDGDYSDDDGNAVSDIQDLALDLTKSTGKESKQELTQRQRQQPRRTFRRRSTTVSRSQQQESSSTNEEQEVDDTSQSSELCLALQRLNRLAVMDSTEYRQRLVESSFPDASGLLTSQRTSATALSESETSALLHLSRSIHRLQSAAANLTTEVDSHTDDMMGLQKQLDEAQKRNSMLEMAVQKLHERNRKLKARSEKDKKKCEILTSKVLQTEQKLNEQGFQLIANQVQNHEHQLLHQTSSSVVVGEEEGRERTDSSFSDVMSTSQKLDPECCGGRKTPQAGQDEVLPTDGMNNSSDVYSVGSSATMSTMTHSMSKVSNQMNHGQQQQQQQLMFDNFGPTLCFSAQSSSTRSQRSCFSYGSGNDFVDGSFTEDDITMTTTTTSIASNSPKSPLPYTVSGRSSVPHVKDNAASSKDRTNAPTMPSLHNPFSKLLGPRQVQPYTLRMVPPFEMQYVALPVPVSAADRSDINPVTHESVTCGESSCVVEDHGMVLSNGESSQPQSEFAFAVCGFNGFSQDFNCKPSLGARLLQINDKPVDPTWTIDDLQEALKCNGRTKLTFRNDRWTKEQDQVLQAAIGRGGVPDETTLPAPRQRASSSDSVGKAIYGIGTLITNQFQASGHQKTISTPAGDVTVDKKEEESPPSPVKDPNSNQQLCLVDNGEKQPTSGSKSEQQATQQHSSKEIHDEQQQKAGRGKEAAGNIRSRLTGVGKLLLIID